MRTVTQPCPYVGQRSGNTDSCPIAPLCCRLCGTNAVKGQISKLLDCISLIDLVPGGHSKRDVFKPAQDKGALKSIPQRFCPE